MKQIALVGNPNTGKTSLFNELTGLKQKVGNYPGITIDKKQGICKISKEETISITDLPGTYSINPTSIDEHVVLESLFNESFDAVIVVSEVENLKRNLLLFSQIKELGLPTILVINMSDQMTRKGIFIDLKKLSEELKTEIVLISSKNKENINALKKVINNISYKEDYTNTENILKKINPEYFSKIQEIAPKKPLYKLWLSISQGFFSKDLNPNQIKKLKEYSDKELIQKYQQKETILRYQEIKKTLDKSYKIDRSKATDLRYRLDKIFTHKIFGYIIFLGLLTIIFQSIFEWSSIPMDIIDESFSNLSSYCKTILPEGKFTNLLTEGIIPGIGGVLIFIPQIAILFLFIALLEESGYMSRVVFIMDKIMRPFGLSGKSIFPFISGVACAIPAVMSARTISNWKERLITILVTPFITCGARLPVYAILISIIIPEKKIFHFFNLQGITLLLLYVLGFITAIFCAFVLNKILKQEKKTFFIIEMPDYKIPSLKNVLFEVYDKTKSFVVDAGKIIIAISIVLWFLASHGGEKFNHPEKHIVSEQSGKNLPKQEYEQKISSYKLENSYIGMMGKTIEPIIKPLGYDWKIGIGLITSFAAREVFIGTLGTIYSIEDTEDETTIKNRMINEINKETGKKRFNFATGMSLLVFYAYAMQCMATLAVVKRETKSWKWPIIQLFGMGIIAYISALLTYQLLN